MTAKKINRNAPRCVINFKATADDNAIIEKIVNRACAMAQLAGWNYDRMDCTMDIKACHLNGNPLHLNRLLDADDFNFAHDVFGIRRNLNRETGQLDNFFSPRTSA